VKAAVAPVAAMSPVSDTMRAAIAAHKAIQATIDSLGSDDAAWEATLEAEDQARRALAETPCQTDADFFAKAAYLLAQEYRLQGGLYAHACAFGDLAFAIELHLEQKGVIVAPAQKGGANV
jgi:hypothetical protein